MRPLSARQEPLVCKGPPPVRLAGERNQIGGGKMQSGHGQGVPFLDLTLRHAVADARLGEHIGRDVRVVAQLAGRLLVEVRLGRTALFLSRHKARCIRCL